MKKSFAYETTSRYSQLYARQDLKLFLNLLFLPPFLILILSWYCTFSNCEGESLLTYQRSKNESVVHLFSEFLFFVRYRPGPTLNASVNLNSKFKHNNCSNCTVRSSLVFSPCGLLIIRISHYHI